MKYVPKHLTDDNPSNGFMPADNKPLPKPLHIGSYKTSLVIIWGWEVLKYIFIMREVGILSKIISRQL